MDDEQKSGKSKADSTLQHELDIAQSQLTLYAKDLKRTIEELQSSEARFRGIVERNFDAIIMVDAKGNISYASPAVERTLGFAPSEMLGQHFRRYVAASSMPTAKDAFRQILAGQEAQNIEVTLTRKDGSEFIALANASPVLEEERTAGAQVIYQDITRRQQAEFSLQDSETRLQAVFDSAQDGILVADTKSGRFILHNAAICEMLGYSAEELLQLSVDDLHPAQDLAFVRRQFERQARGEINLARDLPVLRKDGSVFYADINSSPLKLAGRSCLLGMFHDVTERRQAETALQESRDLLQTVIETVPIRVFWKDRESRYLGCNSLFAQDAGLSAPHELVGRTDHDMGWKEQADLYRADDAAVMASGTSKLGYEEPQTTPDGNTIWLRTSKVPLRLRNEEVIGTLGIYEDITSHKLAELSLQRANRALSALSACNSILVHAKDEQQLLQDMCRMITEQGGYRLAWIGRVEHDNAQSVTPIAHAGVSDAYVESLAITWADNKRGQGPTGRTVRSGTAQIAHNICTDPTFEPWAETAMQHGFGSSISLPLKQQGEVFATLNIYAGEAGAFDEEEVRLLQEMAGDLAFGITSLRTRAAHEQLQVDTLHSAKRAKQALTETILAMALTVEKRDPYTAGHQQRVAKLCGAIAEEMKLPEQFIEGIQLGALIHDIGKIYVPSEILNRPGKLTPAEFELIKTHSQVGYDIVKDVTFPWPVGQMILQHHERLDGSGYPQGLKGDDIILEARILAVADAVEAIGAHRPYRPALGVDPALAEIEQHRGSRYDLEVVDTCLRLFREQGFSFDLTA